MGGDEPYIDWDWVGRHLDGSEGVWARLGAHVQLTLIAIGLGFAISFLLALVIRRWRWTFSPIVWTTGILYTIPSLALFALLVPFTGATKVTAEIGLVSYTLLILTRNILAGLDGVPDDVREAATGMGYSRRQLLLRVDLPLALPVIVAGLRVATVTTIGLVTVTSLIGEENLGRFIVQGIRQLFNTPLVVGAVLSIFLAVVADIALLGLQRLIAPWSQRRATNG
jgi:osmoprotectant transport system permease protein